MIEVFNAENPTRDSVSRLIITEATLQMAMTKLQGFPIHNGPGGELLEPGIIDLIDDKYTTQWQPADPRTKLLVLGAEACKEIVFSAARFTDLSTQKRTIKNLTIPACNLMDAVLELISSLNDEVGRNTRTKWPVTDQNTYVEASRRLKKIHSKGPVRKFRHKLGAHLDLEVFGANIQLKVEDLLRAMGDALLLFMYSLNYKAHMYCWIRGLGASEDGSTHTVETMFDYPACVRWITDADGNVIDIVKVTLAADPRHKIRERIFEAIGTYNSLVKASGAQVDLIWTADMWPTQNDGDNRSSSDVQSKPVV